MRLGTAADIDDGAPVIHLVGHGAATLDLVLFGIPWRRRTA